MCFVPYRKTREAERKLQQLAQFTRDASFPIVQKTYDQQIAEQRQKIMQGLQRAGSDPLGDLAMSKEMMRSVYLRAFICCCLFFFCLLSQNEHASNVRYLRA